MDFIFGALCKINDILWGDYFAAAIFAACIYLSVKSGFFRIKLTSIFKETFGKGRKDRFKAISTALAASMGTGNIIGTAAALAIGGEGAVLWMIIAAFFGMAAAYTENYLGASCTAESSDGTMPPMSYIKKLPAGKYLSVIYASVCVGAAFFMGNMIQGNAACSSAAQLLSSDIHITSLVTAVLMGAVIAGGAERISSAAERLIPIASAAYIIFSLAAIALNYGEIIPAAERVIASAFGFRAAAGGAAGAAVSTAISTGLRRGIFSNEAGMGSSVLVHSAAGSGEPDKTGKWAACEVFIDTVICCTLTAFVIMTSGVSCDDDMAAARAFSLVFGRVGEIFIYVSIIIFAAASMLGWCCYGEIALKSCTKKAVYVKLYRALHVVLLYIGGVSQMKILWQAADICSWFMITINLSAVIILFSKSIPEERKSIPLYRVSEE